MSNGSKSVWIALAVVAAVAFMVVVFVGLAGVAFWFLFRGVAVQQAPMIATAPMVQTVAPQAGSQPGLLAGINLSLLMDKAQALRAEACLPSSKRTAGRFSSTASESDAEEKKVTEKGEYIWREFSENLRNPDELIRALQAEVEKAIVESNGVIAKRIPGAPPQSWRDRSCFRPDVKYTDIGGFCIEFTRDKTPCRAQLILRKDPAGGACPYRLWIDVSELPPTQP